MRHNLLISNDPATRLEFSQLGIVVKARRTLLEENKKVKLHQKIKKHVLNGFVNKWQQAGVGIVVVVVGVKKLRKKIKTKKAAGVTQHNSKSDKPKL
ncbi:hypothetical protein Tco_0349069 [Tanacetum coccineum]